MVIYQVLEYQSDYDEHAIVLRGTYLHKGPADRLRDSLAEEEDLLRKKDQECEDCLNSDFNSKYRCSQYEAMSERNNYCKNSFFKSYKSTYKVVEVKVIED